MNQTTNTVLPPKAKILNHLLEIHNDKRQDPYYWMNDKENPEVIDYLNAENVYLTQSLSHTKNLQDSLFEEIKGRMKPDEATAPYYKNGYWYYLRYEKNKEYPIYCRIKKLHTSPEIVLLNGNELAKDHSYFDIGAMSISNDNKWLAFSTDTFSRRIYTIYFKNLETNTLIEDVLQGVESDNIIWLNDNKTILYIKKDLASLRPFQVFKHTVGQLQSEDELIFEEKDETFYVGLRASLPGVYVYIEIVSTLTTEIRFAHRDDINCKFKISIPRKRDHLYYVTDDGQNFYIKSNENAINFKIMKSIIGENAHLTWENYIEHRSDVLIEDFIIFNTFHAIEERINGTIQLNIIKNGIKISIPLNDTSSLAYFNNNADYYASFVRYNYTSLTTPHTVFDFDIDKNVSTLVKQQEIIGGFNLKEYQSERIFVKGRDGVSIPVTYVFKKEHKKDAGNPCLLYGYGSYGLSIDATFNAPILSLLNRGFIFAIAHIRGGQELGRQWYEKGKLLNKKNTFNDFIDASKYLISSNLVPPNQLYAWGGSAGGLLIGVVINQEPALFNSVIANVPFVDVVTTMLDESIPLTTGEFDEWGNPKDEKYYHYIKSYSPYDNIEEKEYPSILVTSGLHDSQVQYFEPTKWVAKLRNKNKSKNPIYLKTNMEAGHGGASGRYEKYKDYALMYAFIIDQQEKL